MFESFFLLVSVMLAISNGVALKRGRGLTVGISTIAVVIYLVCLWLPSRLQEAGLVKSKIYEAGLLAPPNTDEIQSLCLRWTLELSIVWLAERLSWIGSGRWREWTGSSTARLFRPETTAVVLLVVGVAATIIFQSPLDERASGGQGLQTLLRTCLLCALAIITFYRFFGKKRYVLVVVLGICFLILMNVRSPLFVVFFAYLTSEFVHDKFRSSRRLILTLLIGGSLAMVGSIMSAMRGNAIRNLGLSTSEVIAKSLEKPWLAPFEAGLDTLDGYRFSALVQPDLPPQLYDLLNIFTTFIPRALWPDKPTDLVVELSSAYLGYQGSGQYLSPVGYLTIVFGSYSLGVLALAASTLIFALLIRKLAPSFWVTIILCVAFRFFLGGSSFDIYYGLTLVVPILLIQILLRLVNRPFKGTRSATSEHAIV